MNSLALEKNTKNEKLVNVLSIAIPVAVAILIGIRTKIDLGAWTKILPHVIGLLNTTTSITLIAGFIFIKNKNIIMHRRMMSLSFIQGSLFLVLYILYHVSNASTSYGGDGILKSIYYILLISHIS
ncbi:MAG: DUF420 domain-containing protein, partial [Arcicella sp.]|nr:DUF420 domain-containing protein [Arcicella sp.]